MAKKSKAHVFDAAELQSFHEEFDASRQELSDLNSAHASILGRMEKAGYNREVFKIVAKWLRYDVAKAQDCMRAFKQYADTMGLTDYIDSQGDLMDEAEEEEAAAATG